MFVVFGCRHRNNFSFVGIYLVLSTKPHRASYRNQRAVVCILYQAPDTGAITGSADRSEQYINKGVNRPDSGQLRQSTTLSSQCDQLS